MATKYNSTSTLRITYQPITNEVPDTITLTDGDTTVASTALSQFRRHEDITFETSNSNTVIIPFWSILYVEFTHTYTNEDVDDANCIISEEDTGDI